MVLCVHACGVSYHNFRNYNRTDERLWGKIQMWNDAQVYLTDLGFRIDIAVFENFRLPIAPIDRNDIPQKIVDK